MMDERSFVEAHPGLPLLDLRPHSRHTRSQRVTFGADGESIGNQGFAGLLRVPAQVGVLGRGVVGTATLVG